MQLAALVFCLLLAAGMGGYAIPTQSSQSLGYNWNVDLSWVSGGGQASNPRIFLLDCCNTEVEHGAAGRGSGRFAGCEPVGRDEWGRTSQFLEIEKRSSATGTAVGATVLTKIYGPDTSGVYGGSQGEGGLLGAIEPKAGSGAQIYAMRAVASDMLGNAVARNADGAWQWTNTNVSAYGAQGSSSYIHNAGIIDHTRYVSFRGRGADVGGLVYMGARYYDANTRTFLSADPLDYNAGINLYSYAAGDPVNFTDPDGRVVTKATNEVFSVDTYRDSFDLYQTSSDSWAMGDFGNRLGAVGGYALATVAIATTTIDNATNLIPAFGQGKAAIRTGIREAGNAGLKALANSAAHQADDILIAHVDNAARATPTSLWSKAEFNGTRVYQRNDLIDPAFVDARGRSNLQRMQSGLAPIGPDGKSINLHHMLQTADSPLAELTTTFHQQNSRVIHINPSTTPSWRQTPGAEAAYDAFRSDYWINRANDFSP